MDIWPLIASFLMIAAAELGDKTQLLTLGFSTRFKFPAVIFAVTCASAILMALAVLFGEAVNRVVPEFYLQLTAGVIFILFGVWTIFSKEEGKEGDIKPGRFKDPFFVVFGAFFLAELGDKTQLAALALTAKYGTPLQVWLGATAGMVFINLIAALTGSWVKKYISDDRLRWIGAVIFIAFGSFTLFSLFRWNIF